MVWAEVQSVVVRLLEDLIFVPRRRSNLWASRGGGEGMVFSLLLAGTDLRRGERFSCDTLRVVPFYVLLSVSMSCLGLK